MWKLHRIVAENLCAFRELDYFLSQGVTTLVFGDNRDNESQQSNGSGKSALIECIAVGLTGSPLRKIKNEEIINDKADECWIQLQFTNDSSNEVFNVERQLFRKGASIVTCSIERDGKPIETDEAVQPSVDAYNKYILEKLGISKDELFNNFLLSKFKFQDFLSSSDREKKEIINRFSNGILIDQAIEKLIEDKVPVAFELREAELEIAGIDGRIEMLTEQIATEENNQAEKTRTKTEKVESMRRTIGEKHALIRQKREETKATDCALGKLETADCDIQELENEEHSLEVYLSKIRAILSPLSICLTDWEKVTGDKHTELNALEAEQTKWSNALSVAEDKMHTLTTAHDRLKAEYRSFSDAYTTQVDGYDEKLKTLDGQIDRMNRDTLQLKEERRTLSKAIEELTTRLAGTITCPDCGYEFLLSDKTFDVAQGTAELEDKNAGLENVTSRIAGCEKKGSDIEKEERQIRTDKRSLSAENNIWNDKLEQAARQIRTASGELEEIRSKQKAVKASISTLWTILQNMCKRVFDEAFDLIDNTCREKERQMKSLQDDIKSAESSIETLEEAIRELDGASVSELVGSLKASLKTYRKKSSDAVTRKSDIEARIGRLDGQEQRFAQFKTYLANTKIEALSTITNEFLENIGSDIRIRFSGYTALKSGKVREKISVSLIRDGIDQGSFGKFSAGEAARVNLATILAMQKLINSNAELDKGLALLVLDEILEAVDESGLASMFSALNKIGITALVVSHGNVAEGYPHKLVVTKENGESKI
ncbi:AAA family ATPase [Parabacteroides goldsteinii]|uniref:AAA family ATPase n=1 Tax=Parabacteroides goldsteinii TaxID=328812 RepID=UPI001DD19715|nr:SMC family ATPase [Parabacteroides goldsteinii]MBS6574766.1 SMC family ATPase [Parabacteroides goldsteinii]